MNLTRKLKGAPPSLSRGWNCAHFVSFAEQQWGNESCFYYFILAPAILNAVGNHLAPMQNTDHQLLSVNAALQFLEEPWSTLPCKLLALVAGNSLSAYAPLWAPLCCLVYAWFYAFTSKLAFSRRISPPYVCKTQTAKRALQGTWRLWFSLSLKRADHLVCPHSSY